MKIENKSQVKLKFIFEEHIRQLLNSAPVNDLKGIRGVVIVDSFSHSKCYKESLGCYIPNHNGKSSIIELNLQNILREKIPKYLFDDYPEIAALFLSEILFHEIGHNAHLFRRHKIRPEFCTEFKKIEINHPGVLL